MSTPMPRRAVRFRMNRQPTSSSAMRSGRATAGSARPSAVGYLRIEAPHPPAPPSTGGSSLWRADRSDIAALRARSRLLGWRAQLPHLFERVDERTDHRILLAFLEVDEPQQRGEADVLPQAHFARVGFLEREILSHQGEAQAG